ncbi:uncharacterized protein E0L32_001265 [Thyridium curvatum]|uniref:NTF2-like domain-containing protein n=1 Tax=Thyridium curvatum TaxID=1093900 RepID=A0A507AZ33_9PEZI|nr:uncharacterized protein E0L32_001265 [Thyridium curvatum]TPX10068.1 hypothetical protein E0L32_001265 [Thyridium curvatum]
MRFSAAIVLVAGVLAAAVPNACLSPSDADSLVKVYRDLIAAYDPAVADKYLADNFIEYSDSINILAGMPLGSPTFPSKDVFKQVQSVNPPFPLAVEKVTGVACNTISLIWSGAFGQAAKSVRGITVITAAKKDGAKGCWKISRLDVEFNSIAWLEDEGGSYQLPPRPTA